MLFNSFFNSRDSFSLLLKADSKLDSCLIVWRRNSVDNLVFSVANDELDNDGEELNLVVVVDSDELDDVELDDVELDADKLGFVVAFKFNELDGDELDLVVVVDELDDVE